MTSGHRPLTWIVGRGGLLGQHLAHVISQDGQLWAGRPVPWSSPDSAARELRAQARDFAAASAGSPWQVAWAAGAGVTGTDAATLRNELDAFRATLDALGEYAGGHRGAVFLASSAGGVYAGVGSPPYDEFSPVRPLAPYGEAKLQAETLLAEWSRVSSTPVLAGRIANLYGPGQNLDKAQGLISQLCRSHLTAQPLSIYVSLDTLRDYIYAPDCARLVAESLHQLRVDQAASTSTLSVTKVLATQRAVTIGALIGEMRRLFKKAPRIVVGSSPISAFQARDLSLRSGVWPWLDRGPLTPLPVGIHATAEDLGRRLQAGWEVPA